MLTLTYESLHYRDIFLISLPLFYHWIDKSMHHARVEINMFHQP